MFILNASNVYHSFFQRTIKHNHIKGYVEEEEIVAMTY